MSDASPRVVIYIADAHALGVAGDGANRFLDRLSPDERRQLAALGSSKPYLQFLLSRVLLRTALHAWDGAHAGAWTLQAEPSGRPYLQGGAVSAPRVSLSHSGTTVVCALAQTGDVGVDVEMDRAREIDAIAAEVLEESELTALNRLAGDARRRTFFQLWTLKEACSKALGTGMATPFRELVFRLDAAGIGFTSVHARTHTEFVSFIPHPDGVAALALLLPRDCLEPNVRFYRMTGLDRVEDADVAVLASTLRSARPVAARRGT